MTEHILMTILWIASGSLNILYRKSSAQNHPLPWRLKVKRTFFGLLLVVMTLFPVLYYTSYKYSEHLLEQDKLIEAVVVMIPCLVISGVIFWILTPAKKKKISGY